MELLVLSYLFVSEYISKGDTVIAMYSCGKIPTFSWIYMDFTKLEYTANCAFKKLSLVNSLTNSESQTKKKSRIKFNGWIKLYKI